MKTVISFEEFKKLDLRIAKIVKVEEVEGADRLLEITLDVGDLGEKVVAAGIKEWYRPKDLVGKLVVYLANLEPREIRGVKSQGMIVAAGEERAYLLHPDQVIEPGTIIK